MKARLLELLACPDCGSEIDLAEVSEREGDEILTGELVCADCQKRFEILRGVTRFAELAEIERDKAKTADNFGWQWTRFTQQDERYREQFLGWLQPIKPEFFRGKTILEAGCGKGRHTRLAAQWGASEVVGVDLSAAVETAFAATRGLPNAHIVQADIYKLPFKSAFDYAFSVGVLHHLPDPKAGFFALSGKVRAGGGLSVWVYGAENNGWITSFVNPIRERFTSRLDQNALFQLSKLPTAAVYLATKFVYAPLNRNPATAKFAEQLFYNDYLNNIARFGWREQHNIVFDHLVAPTAHYISQREFEMWWREVQGEDVEITWHNQNSWCGFGKLL